MDKPALKPLKPKPESKLTFSDGLNFGCGFWVAGFLFTVAAIPVAVVIFTVIASLLKP